MFSCSNIAAVKNTTGMYGGYVEFLMNNLCTLRNPIVFCFMAFMAFMAYVEYINNIEIKGLEIINRAFCMRP